MFFKIDIVLIIILLYNEKKEKAVFMMNSLKSSILDVPNYPKAGVIFKDLTPILANHTLYAKSIDLIVKAVKENFPETTHIAAPEARGYWFGCPTAIKGGWGFIPIRKPGKLPRKTITVKYDLEYGKETICMHSDSLKIGDKVVIIDDVLATGGTIGAMEDLIMDIGAKVLGSVVLLELLFLNGREHVKSKLFAIISE